MRVLITGATGFVGSRLREFVRNDGHEVRLLVRRGHADAFRSGVPADEYEVVFGDIFETNTCLHACDGCDTVIHLVGIIREFPARGITFEEFHRVATANIVDAAKRTGVERFVHMSALGARENAASEYHRTKRAAERIVEGSGLRWTIFRPSWIFAPGDGMSRMIKDVVRKPAVPLIDGGGSQVQPVALDDVCRFFARALRMPETQGKIFELGGPDRISYRELFEQAATLMRRRVRTVTVPSAMIRPAVSVLQRFESFPLTIDQLKMLSEDNVCDIGPLVQMFNVQPASFREALPGMFG